MLTITEGAREKIVELTGKSPNPVKGLRISADAVSPLKVDYRMAFIGEDQATDADQVIPFEGFDVYVDADSQPHVDEAVVDHVEGLMGSGFKIERPRVLPDGVDGDLLSRVQTVLDERINPSVSGHGGRVSLIDLRDKTVFLQLEGGCQGCGMADVTLKQGIEVMIKESVPEIEAIYDVTDHANGKNPYYKEPVG
ncbi:MAG TPA: NifU family protein [Candidatus Latescibacteria bacterium]|jgi:Fe/S biogenesis protein NfuA|nr:Fe/S biogenesis protein NfuA [Gemmatimonadaceae bacterium]HJP31986.1 NifU family protein [Candidatus Latescibacterota bacterium]